MRSEAERVVWLSPVEYARIFELAYTTVAQRCWQGQMPGARKDPANGYFWQIPVEQDAYDILTKEA